MTKRVRDKRDDIDRRERSDFREDERERGREKRLNERESLEKEYLFCISLLFISHSKGEEIR